MKSKQTSIVAADDLQGSRWGRSVEDKGEGRVSETASPTTTGRTFPAQSTARPNLLRLTLTSEGSPAQV